MREGESCLEVNFKAKGIVVSGYVFRKGIYMWKDRMRFLRDAVIKHSKVAFPVIVIIAVAVTVALALGAGSVEEKMAETVEPETIESSSVEEVTLDRVIPEVPLEKSEDSAIFSLMATYYNALANGDVAAIQSISNCPCKIEFYATCHTSK